MSQLEALLQEYYEHYYHDLLGLPDWEKRVEWRLEEEHNFVESVVQRIEGWINYDFTGKRVLVVGAGTGGEVVVLHRRGADVYGIEPDETAYEIVCLKTKQLGLNSEKYLKHGAEQIPFKDDYFDFVYCFTVLEHVTDVEQSIDEMIRVTMSGGRIFIETPDYRQFYEPHYKIMMPMIAPRWLLQIWLRCLGRPGAFFDTACYITGKQLRNIFKHRPVTAMQIIHPWPSSWTEYPKPSRVLIKWMTQTFGIMRDQWWLIQKL